MITHSQLVEIGYKLVLTNMHCGIAFKELVAANKSGECADVIGFGSFRSVLIECKVSRTDFLKDARKIFRKQPELGMGSLRYYMCPTDLISVLDLPRYWGLIYVGHNKKPRIIRHAIKQTYDTENEKAVMYSALRRLFIKGRFSDIYDGKYNKFSNSQLLKIHSAIDERREDNTNETMGLGSVGEMAG